MLGIASRCHFSPLCGGDGSLLLSFVEWPASERHNSFVAPHIDDVACRDIFVVVKSYIIALFSSLERLRDCRAPSSRHRQQTTYVLVQSRQRAVRNPQTQRWTSYVRAAITIIIQSKTLPGHDDSLVGFRPSDRIRRRRRRRRRGRFRDRAVITRFPLSELPTSSEERCVVPASIAGDCHLELACSLACSLPDIVYSEQ